MGHYRGPEIYNNHAKVYSNTCLLWPDLSCAIYSFTVNVTAQRSKYETIVHIFLENNLNFAIPLRDFLFNLSYKRVFLTQKLNRKIKI